MSRRKIVPNNAGLRQYRQARSSGAYIGVYDGEAAGMDTDAGRWQTVCENHGNIISHATLALARGHAVEPEEWCEGCAAVAAAIPAPTSQASLTWWVWPLTGGHAPSERMRYERTMRGTWGWDATCSCGWESRTGGAVRRYVLDAAYGHLFTDHGIRRGIYRYI